MIAFERIASQLVVDARFDQNPAQRADRMRVGIVRVCVLPIFGVGQPGEICAQRDLVRRPLRAVQRSAGPAFPICGKDNARRRRTLLEQKGEQPIGHDRPIDCLGRIGRPQPQRRAAQPSGGRHIPDRGNAAHCGRNRLFHAALGIELHEIEDPMIERAHARHHRGPHERRQRRVNRLEHAALALTDDPREVRHRAARDFLVEHLPVGAVEPDKQHRACGSRSLDAGSAARFDGRSP